MNSGWKLGGEIEIEGSEGMEYELVWVRKGGGCGKKS